MGHRTERHIFRDEADADAFERKARAGMLGQPGYSETYVVAGKEPVTLVNAAGETYPGCAWAVETETYYG